MTKRALSLFFVLAAFAFAGPLLQKEPAAPALDSDTTSIDLATVPMDDIDVTPQEVATASAETRTAALSRAISAAAIATPEPATYAAAATALFVAGIARRRQKR